MKRLIYAAVLAMAILISTSLIAFQPASAETSNANIVVQTIPGPSIQEKVGQRLKQSWPWYVTRASGFIAAGSLVMLMLSGMGMVGGATFRFLEPLTAWASHRALGFVFGVSLLAHMLALLADNFVPFNVLDLLVPWLSNYKPMSLFGVSLGSFYVALGVLAFYGVVLIIVTSIFLVDKKPHFWKLVHLLSYLVMAFVFVHALYLGTDLADGPFRTLWIAAGLILGVAFLIRLRRAKSV